MEILDLHLMVPSVQLATFTTTMLSYTTAVILDGKLVEEPIQGNANKMDIGLDQSPVAQVMNFRR